MANELEDISRCGRIPQWMQIIDALSGVQDARAALDLIIRSTQATYGREVYLSLFTGGLKPGSFAITRWIDSDGRERVKPKDLALASSGSITSAGPPVQQGGLLGQLVATGEPKLIRYLNLPDDPVLGDALAHCHSLMALPIHRQGRPDAWVVLLDHTPGQFGPEDLEQAFIRVNLFSSMVVNLQTAQALRQAHSRIQREVERIADIQRSLLPQPMPSIPGLEISASYNTYDQAGGDLYDVSPLQASGGDEPTRWTIMVADASGHGPSAAVVAAMMHAIVRTGQDLWCDPGRMLAHANRHLLTKQIEHSFVTAFLAVYEPATRVLRFANAGHHPPLLKVEPGPARTVTRLDGGANLPLGVLEDVEYQEMQVQLHPGQTLLLYTDGVTESMSAGRKMFGVEGIVQALTQCSGEAGCAVDSVFAALRKHEAGSRPQDDQTVVAMRVLH